MVFSPKGANSPWNLNPRDTLPMKLGYISKNVQLYCRVDYTQSPTAYQNIILKVIGKILQKQYTVLVTYRYLFFQNSRKGIVTKFSGWV